MNESAINVPGPPPFVKMKEGCDDISDPNSWDGWSVTSTGDLEADYKLGADYCDIALRKVIATESPGAVTFSLTAMLQKLVTGEIQASPIEKGFMDCLARRAADRRAQLDGN